MTAPHDTTAARTLTRRSLLLRTGSGIGAVAMADLLAGAQPATVPRPVLPHFPPRARRIICFFMSGGLSQLESFDDKPELRRREHQPLPDSVFRGRKPLGMSRLQAVFPVQPSPFPFARHGASGALISDRFPHLARHADRLCFLKGMVSEAVNHDPAIIFTNSGHQLPGRPVLGSWLSYGLGSENADLPSFVVMVSRRPVDQPLSSRLWDSGFLPSQHQGTPFRAGTEPVLYLRNPEGLPDDLHARSLDALRSLQQHEFARRGDPAIMARMEQHELAFRMQAAVPAVTDLASEPENVMAAYGPDARKPGSFAANCILARRMAERGVRFIQLFHPGWDHHGDLRDGFLGGAAEIDQPIAALLDDLDARGLMDDTLVLFLTEFGRTPYSQGGLKDLSRYGREHHRNAFTCWMTGAGIRQGISHGVTDDFGFDVVDGRVTVNDLHATILHLMGIRHEHFTYPWQGRDFRLTDVAGTVVRQILA
jgi:hypothetical protein